LDNKAKITAAFDCFTKEELAIIEGAPDAFKDKCFGEKADD